MLLPRMLGGRARAGLSKTAVRYELNTLPQSLHRRSFSSTLSVKKSTKDVKITDRLSMAGKTVLVTGGGRGIGFAICKAIAQLGGNVAVLDALPEPVPEFETLKTDYGTQAFYERVDVTDESSLQTGFNNIIKESSSIQGCVTAAGIALDKPFFDHTWAECQRVLAVNVLGTFWAAKLAAEHMTAQKQGGSIVLIASVAAQGIKLPMQNLSIYNMSKAAVKGLVGPLAAELGEVGVRVNSISPGVIDSPMTQGLGVQYPKLVDMFHHAPPLRRIGRPEDLTPLVAYLLSDASAFTTGADFPVTGGLHAGLSPAWVERS